jgi:hypothetical protein
MPKKKPAITDPKSKLKYPHYMSWRRRQWVLRRGQVLIEEHLGDEPTEPTIYKVDHVTRSPIQGEPPRIVLELLKENAE